MLPSNGLEIPAQGSELRISSQVQARKNLCWPATNLANYCYPFGPSTCSQISQSNLQDSYGNLGKIYRYLR